jgi:hypothetical protein
MTKSRIALSKINCSPSGTRQNPTRHRLTKIGPTMSQEEHPATSTWRNRGLRNNNNNHIAVRVKAKSSRSAIFPRSKFWKGWATPNSTERPRGGLRCVAES